MPSPSPIHSHTLTFASNETKHRPIDLGRLGEKLQQETWEKQWYEEDTRNCLLRDLYQGGVTIDAEVSINSMRWPWGTPSKPFVGFTTYVRGGHTNMCCIVLRSRNNQEKVARSTPGGTMSFFLLDHLTTSLLKGFDCIVFQTLTI